MSLTSQEKQAVKTKFERAKGDTGSPEVQIALLSENISQLTTHFQTNKNDNHSRRGLLQMVSKRRKLLTYLKRVDKQRYTKLVEALGIRG